MITSELLKLFSQTNKRICNQKRTREICHHDSSSKKRQSQIRRRIMGEYIFEHEIVKTQTIFGRSSSLIPSTSPSSPSLSSLSSINEEREREQEIKENIEELFPQSIIIQIECDITTANNIETNCERVTTISSFSSPSSPSSFIEEGEVERSLLSLSNDNKKIIEMPAITFRLLQLQSYVCYFLAFADNLNRKEGFKTIPQYPILFKMLYTDLYSIPELDNHILYSAMRLLYSWSNAINTSSKRVFYESGHLLHQELMHPDFDRHFCIYSQIDNFLGVIYRAHNNNSPQFLTFMTSKHQLGLNMLMTFLNFKQQTHIHIRLLKECEAYSARLSPGADPYKRVRTPLLAKHCNFWKSFDDLRAYLLTQTPTFLYNSKSTSFNIPAVTPPSSSSSSSSSHTFRSYEQEENRIYVLNGDPRWLQFKYNLYALICDMDTDAEIAFAMMCCIGSQDISLAQWQKRTKILNLLNTPYIQSVNLHHATLQRAANLHSSSISLTDESSSSSSSSSNEWSVFYPRIETISNDYLSHRFEKGCKVQYQRREKFPTFHAPLSITNKDQYISLIVKKTEDVIDLRQSSTVHLNGTTSDESNGEIDPFLSLSSSSSSSSSSNSPNEYISFLDHDSSLNDNSSSSSSSSSSSETIVRLSTLLSDDNDEKEGELLLLSDKSPPILNEIEILIQNQSTGPPPISLRELEYYEDYKKRRNTIAAAKQKAMWLFLMHIDYLTSNYDREVPIIIPMETILEPLNQLPVLKENNCLYTSTLFMKKKEV